MEDLDACLFLDRLPEQRLRGLSTAHKRRETNLWIQRSEGYKAV
jgi:hypothetical protein